MARTAIAVALSLLVLALALVPGPNVRPGAAHSLINYRLMVQHDGKCLDVIGFATQNGSPVAQWDCNGLANQQWDIVQTADGYHNLKPRHTTGKCLDVLGFATNDGATLAIWTCNGFDNQKFTFPWLDAGATSARSIYRA